jgi:hypothetical protein
MNERSTNLRDDQDAVLRDMGEQKSMEVETIRKEFEIKLGEEREKYELKIGEIKYKCTEKEVKWKSEKEKF